VPALPLELGFEPALEAIHHLEQHVVVMLDAQLGAERRGHADDVSRCQPVGGSRDVQVTVGGVFAQAATLEVGLGGMTDRETLGQIR
jgi:hypothetical protein